MQIFFWHFGETSDVVFGLWRKEVERADENEGCKLWDFKQLSREDEISCSDTSEVSDFTPAGNKETFDGEQKRSSL